MEHQHFQGSQTDPSGGKLTPQEAGEAQFRRDVALLVDAGIFRWAAALRLASTGMSDEQIGRIFRETLENFVSKRLKHKV